jgi:hypothetical protein
MKRKAELEVTDKGLGWSMTCKECPLLPHLTALKEKRRICTGGIITNAQGPVVLGGCEYLVKDSLDGKTQMFECSYDEVKKGG